MKLFGLLNVWRGRLLPSHRDERTITLQTVGLDGAEVDRLRPLFAELSRRLGVAFVLHRHSGDLVLVGTAFCDRLSPQVLYAVYEERSVIAVPQLSDAQRAEGADPPDTQTVTALLLRQLCDTPMVRRQSPLWGAGGWDAEIDASRGSTIPHGLDSAAGIDTRFDSRLDTQPAPAPDTDTDLARQHFIAVLMQGMRRQGTPVDAMQASYGPGANLHIDFTHGLVRIDPLALQALRVRKELPVIDEESQPGPEVPVREIEEMVWHFGIASGRYRLLDEPQDGWHTPVRGVNLGAIERYSRQPRHLELARHLLDGAATPAALRRQARMGTGELRSFLQACLFLGLVEWAPEGSLNRRG